MKPLFITVVCLTIIPAVRIHAEAEIQTATSKALATLTGADSHMEKPAVELALTAERWLPVWATHLGTTLDDPYRSSMEVDFDHCMVVAIFRGAKINVRGLAIDSISETASSTRIRITDVGYQTAGQDNKKPPDRPYAIIVLPKANKPLIIEENVQSYKGGPPEWKEWMRLAPPKSR